MRNLSAVRAGPPTFFGAGPWFSTGTRPQPHHWMAKTTDTLYCKVVLVPGPGQRRSLVRRGRVVFTNGCFDLLHRGHVELLNAARQLGDMLVVGLNSDRSVRQIKGEGRPVNCEFDRAVVLAGLESVDKVFVFDESSPQQLVEELRPDILVKGSDWEGKAVAGADFVVDHGGHVVFLPILAGYSTTAMIRRLQ